MSCNSSQDVGTWGDGRDGRDDPGSETYLTMNGLSAANDAVLGDYEIWAEGRELSPWTITARSGGELLWIAGGVIPEFEEETEHLTATVSSYAESDCTIDAYGETELTHPTAKVRQILRIFLAPKVRSSISHRHHHHHQKR